MEEHRRALLYLTLGWALLASNSGLISFALPLISREWSLSGSQVGVLLNSFLAGMLVGAAAVGRAADRFGRRPAASASLLALSLSTAACALSVSYTHLTLPTTERV